MKKRALLPLAILIAPVLAFGQTVILNDSWADGDLSSGSDPLAGDWFTSTSSSAIEVSVGSMGVVSGSSGRGIHGLMSAQSLNIGDNLTSTFSFRTPATVGTARDSALRFAVVNSLGRPELASNQSLSSSNPNPLFDGLPAYMVDFDVVTGSESTGLREHDVTATLGRFMSTTSEWISLGSGGNAYTFMADTDYVAILSVTRTGADEMTVFASLSMGGGELSSHSELVSGVTNMTFDMLGVQVNSATFGTSNVPDTADNGIDFSNIMVVYTPVPEPSTYVLLLGALALAVGFLRRRKI